MFTWICPTCKAEVPPAYNECPNCAKATAAVSQPAAPVAAPPVAQPPSRPPESRPALAASAPAAAPAAFTNAPSARVYPAPRRAFPAWLASLLTAGGMLLVLAIVYFWIIPSRRAAPVESRAAAPQGAGSSVLSGSSEFAKSLELTGFRITESANQRIQVRFLVVNHSGAELPPLSGDVVLKTGRADTVIEFPFKLPSIGPYESREVTSTTKTTLRAYELPDWQFIRPQFSVSEQ